MFDTDRLKRCSFKPRTVTLPVKPLAVFFAEGETPEFTVRGLSGEEFACCNQAAKAYAQVGEIVSGILSQEAADKVNALKIALGLGDGIPEDYARRIEYLLTGCVSPELDREAVVKIGHIAPIEFQWLTNEILRLSGEGAEIAGE